MKHVWSALLAAVLPLSAMAGATTDWQSSRQLVLVVTPDWNSVQGSLRTYQREGGRWHEVGDAQAVVIGESGVAWGLGLQPVQTDGPQKHEGDGRSAAGVFRIGDAFGYGARATTALHYRALQASDYCMDVEHSPYYNRIVDANEVGEKAVAGSSEPMRRDLHLNGDQAYKLGFVIEQNPKAVAGHGSCIFAHLWKSPTSGTAGCTAMPEVAMQRLLAWLKPEDQPVFVLLPMGAYVKLHTSWKLPAIPVK